MRAENNKELVTVKSFENSFSANLAGDKLKEFQINSFIEEQNVIGLNPLGEVELKVDVKDLKKAKEILSA